MKYVLDTKTITSGELKKITKKNLDYNNKEHLMAWQMLVENKTSQTFREKTIVLLSIAEDTMYFEERTNERIFEYHD